MENKKQIIHVTQNILSLPMYPELTTTQLERILDTILQSTLGKK